MPPAESARSGGVAVATAAAQTRTVRRAPIHRQPGDRHHTLLSYCENQSVNKEHNYMSFDHQGYCVFFFFLFNSPVSLPAHTGLEIYPEERGLLRQSGVLL